MHAWWLYSVAILGNQVISNIILSWHCDNQSLPYSNNVEHLARKWQVYILSSHWFDSTRVEPTISRTRARVVLNRLPCPIRSLGGIMVSKPAWYTRDLGSITTLVPIFSIFITPMTRVPWPGYCTSNALYGCCTYPVYVQTCMDV